MWRWIKVPITIRMDNSTCQKVKEGLRAVLIPIVISNARITPVPPLPMYPAVRSRFHIRRCLFLLSIPFLNRKWVTR
jgi:hypothetical protein